MWGSFCKEDAVERIGTDVLVIGGGAAGLMAAIAAARTGAQVTLLEQGERLGKKILVTGNGRCNLSNTALTAAGGFAQYNQPDFVAPTLSRYDFAALQKVFEELGLLTIADERGWVFPRSRWANSVLDVLVGAQRRLGVAVVCGRKVARVAPAAAGGFVAETAKESFSCSRLVLAYGGAAVGLALAKQPMNAPVPILGPLKTDGDSIKGLDGVRAHCRATVLRKDEPVVHEVGEVLFRSYGVSGIAIFNLSRFTQSGDELSLDFFCELSHDELLALLSRRSRTSADEFFEGMFHTRVASAVMRRAGLRSSEAVSDNKLNEIATICKDYRLSITSQADKKQAQVMRGGFSPEGFDAQTLESRTYPGLYAAGECLDVDGPCGGFNLHWAFASGLVAGEGVGLS
jgi:predicted Rossmann fold flavoprotein